MAHVRLTNSNRTMPQGEMMRLDEPCHRLDAAVSGQGIRTIGAWIGSRLIGLASMSQQLPPGPPMRGCYRIHDVAICTTERAHARRLIARCIRDAAANQARMLWCCALLDSIDIWCGCGFTPATPAAGKSSQPWVRMVRRIAPLDAYPALVTHE